MKTFVRVLIGVAGLFGLAAAVMFWAGPERAAAGVGLALANATGAATIRADIGGFFAASGLFALLGAARGRADAALVTLVLMAFALFGRLVNVAIGGWNPILLPPMAIEIVVIALFAFAYRVLSAAPR